MTEKFAWIKYTLLLIPILIPLNFIFTYILAVYYDHVDPIFPYISDAGTNAPEAGFFAQILSFTAILCLITFWVRYLQVKYVYETLDTESNPLISPSKKKLLLRLNLFALLLGVCSVLCILSVASYRVSELVEFHFMSAIPLFIILPVLIKLQTWMSFLMAPHVNTLRVAKIRLFLTILINICGLITGIFGLWSIVAFGKPYDELLKKIRHWDSSDAGYVQHCISAIGEWLFFIFFSFYFVTFIGDFKRADLDNGRVKTTLLTVNNLELKKNNNTIEL